MNTPDVRLNNIALPTPIVLIGIPCLGYGIKLVASTGCGSQAVSAFILLPIEVCRALVERRRQLVLVVAPDAEDFVGFRVGNPDHQQPAGAIHPFNRTRRPVSHAQSRSPLQRNFCYASGHTHRYHHLADFQLNADDLRSGILRPSQTGGYRNHSRHAEKQPGNQRQRRDASAKRLETMQTIHNSSPLE